MKSKEELKKLFENGDKPTQENFWEWQDSYWHKDEKLLTENTGGYKIKGSVPDLTALHLMNSMTEGDVYNLLDTGDNYVYVLDLNNTGEAGWDKLSGIIDTSAINLQTVLDNSSIAISNSNAYSIYLGDENGLNPSVSFSQGYFNGSTSSGTSFIQTLNVQDSEALPRITLTTIKDNNAKTIILGENALAYHSDYSFDYTQRSLVDKAYVDSVITNSSKGNFIPLTGTEAGKPMTGPIILDNEAVIRTSDYSMQFGASGGRPLIATHSFNSTNSSTFSSYVEGFEVQLQRNRDTTNTTGQQLIMVDGRSTFTYAQYEGGGSGVNLDYLKANIEAGWYDGSAKGYLNIATQTGKIELKTQTTSNLVGIEIDDSGIKTVGVHDVTTNVSGGVSDYPNIMVQNADGTIGTVNSAPVAISSETLDVVECYLNRMGNAAFVRLHVTGTITTTQDKHLSGLDSSGFGDFAKIVPVVATVDGSIKFIKILSYNGSPTISLVKAVETDDDFDFVLNDSFMLPYKGTVIPA